MEGKGRRKLIIGVVVAVALLAAVWFGVNASQLPAATEETATSTTEEVASETTATSTTEAAAADQVI